MPGHLLLGECTHSAKLEAADRGGSGNLNSLFLQQTSLIVGFLRGVSLSQLAWGETFDREYRRQPWLKRDSCGSTTGKQLHLSCPEMLDFRQTICLCMGRVLALV